MGVVGYVRVSRVGDREGERFISTVEQEKAIRGWAELHGRQVDEVIEDLDQTGSKRDRPGLERAMSLVRDGADGIVVARLDRFGRSVPHLGELLDLLTRYEAALWTVAEGIDTSGNTGRMVANILSAIAEYEVARIGEAWRVARTNAVERGVWVGGNVPVGYRKLEDGRLVVADHADAVQELFSRRIAGQSWASLAEWFGQRIGQEIAIPSVRYVISNRAYLGESHGGQGIVNLRAHEPLVDAPTWEAANRADTLAPERSGRATGLLAGIVRCSGCRYALRPSMRADGSLDYVCKSRSRTHREACPAPVSISAPRVDGWIVEEFLAHHAELRATGTSGEADLERALEALAAARQRRDGALDSRLAEILGPDSEAHLRVIEEAEREVRDAEAEVGRIREGMDALPDFNVAEMWPDLSLAEQRQLLASAIDCAFVFPGRRGPNSSRERLHICWRGESPEVPTRGRRWTPRPFDRPPLAGSPGEDVGPGAGD